MPKWELFGVAFGHRVGGDRAIYRRQLRDGTLLLALVRDAQGRPECDEIVARFPNGARNFGREIAIAELERVINDNDNDPPSIHDARTGEPVSFFALSEIPVGTTLRGSRGRRTTWTDRRLAELVHDLQHGDAAHWYLRRNSIRQRANEAVRRGIGEVAAEGPPKRWRLTAHGVELLQDEDR